MDKPKEMKQSTWEHALEQCRKNGERMEREARGDYGPPLLITFTDSEQERKNLQDAAHDS